MAEEKSSNDALQMWTLISMTSFVVDTIISSV